MAGHRFRGLRFRAGIDAKVPHPQTNKGRPSEKDIGYFSAMTFQGLAWI